MVKLTMIQAINIALDQEMNKDESVVVLGEDVGRDGGVFRATEGLFKKYGDKRVIDTPLAEAGIAGMSVGMAINGLRPVAEFQFDGFTYPAFQQIISHAAKYRTRSRGRFNLPIVFRFPFSGGIRALEHHSESPESYFAHTSGLKVVVPSNPIDAKGLLISAIRDPDPVVFMEPKKQYRAFREDVPEKDYAIPLGQASIVQEGSDVTIISYGSMMRTSLEAAAKLAEENIHADVIDLRTLVPLDEKTIIKSVEKTGRVVIVNEAPRTCGFSAELIARIQEKALLSLEAPIERVTGWDTPIPLYKLENNYFPDAFRVIRGVKKVIGF